MRTIAVDVGGTFTDAVLVIDGRLYAAKVPTTPHDQAQAVLEAVALVADAAGVRIDDSFRFSHGTTVATNALLERRVAVTALIATDGFTDVLDLARQDRPQLYRLSAQRAHPLVEEDHKVAANERVTAWGRHVELTDDAIADLCSAVAELPVDAVAICLLHSWRDPAHERRLAAALRLHAPSVHVVASHELTREFREYERASTTVIDAALTPRVAPYLRSLTSSAQAVGLPAPLVMQSHGGLDAAAAVIDHAARAVLSGPAGGVVAARRLIPHLDVEGLLCFDMGGTSCDVATVTCGGLPHTAGRKLAGYPLQLPSVDMHTIGSGGSSIVSVDAGGALQVGPHSAGSLPGPACYGHGGRELTITDCHLIVGNLAEHSLQHWHMQLDSEAALGAALRVRDRDPVAVASGAIAVATAQMTEAARVVSVGRGHDPAALALLSYGGAGGLHACDMAHDLGCSMVVVPLSAGVFSAVGIAAADVRRERVLTVQIQHEEGSDRPQAKGLAAARAWVVETIATLEHGLARDIAVAPAKVRGSLLGSMRFRGQTHELSIAIADDLHANAPGELNMTELLALAARRFRDQHVRRYGFELQQPVETVTLRAACSVDGPALDACLEPAGGVPWQTLYRSGAAGVDGEPGAAIDLPHGTCLIPHGWSVVDERAGCLVLTPSQSHNGHQRHREQS